MFDLEKAIADWRGQMIAAGVKKGEVLNELEAHLRDDLKRLVESGLGPEGAFGVAVQRIGQSDRLAIEFEKTALVHEERARRMKLLCIVFVSMAYILPFALSIPKPWSGMDPAQRWLGLAAIALTVLSLFSGLLLRRMLPIIPDRRIRTRIQCASVIPVFIWLIAFAFVILPRLELTFGEVTVATLWAISPLAIFGGLTFGLDEADYQARNQYV
jgi:hypothetical protein